MNVTDALDFFAEEMIKVGKEESGTSAFNKVYGKFKADQDKAQTRQLLELVSPCDTFTRFAHYFQLNLDETSFLCN